MSFQTAGPTPPTPLNLASGVTAVDEHIGPGKLLEAGDKVTVHYRVWGDDGREYADSTKRGLPFTMVLGDRNSDPIVSVVLAGMHSGGIRTAVVPASKIPDQYGSILPSDTDLHIWINVLAAKSHR